MTKGKGPKVGSAQNKQALKNKNKNKNKNKGKGMQNVNAPVAIGSVFTNNSGDGAVTMSGTDYISLATVQASSLDGEIVANIDLSPQGLVNTHFAGMASGFERYKFTQVTIEVVTRIPTNVGGGYIAAVNPDVRGEVPTGENGKHVVRSWSKSVAAPWYSSSRVAFDTSRSLSWYFVNSTSEERYPTIQAKFVLMVDGPPIFTNSMPLTLGINIRWKAKFAFPTIGLTSVHPGSWTFPKGAHFGHQEGKNYCYFPDSPAIMSDFWYKSKYGVTYGLSPPIKIKNKAGEDTRAAAFQIAKTDRDSWLVGFFETIEESAKVNFQDNTSSAKDLSSHEVTLVEDAEVFAAVQPKQVQAKPAIPHSYNTSGHESATEVSKLIDIMHELISTYSTFGVGKVSAFRVAAMGMTSLPDEGAQATTIKDHPVFTISEDLSRVRPATVAAGPSTRDDVSEASDGFEQV